MNFLETKKGKIVGHVIHEHANGNNLILGVTSILKKVLDKDGELSKNLLLEYLEIINRGCKRSNDAIDFLYTELKKEFEDDNRQSNSNIVS